MNQSSNSIAKDNGNKVAGSERGSLIIAYVKKMQPRERMLAILALCAGIVVISSEIISSIQETFRLQEVRQEQALNEIDLASAALFRYTTLKTRQRAIEEAYKQVEIEGPVPSYLEKLLREKAGVATGFTINGKASRQFGGNYEQTPYTIRFTTVDMTRLIEFLKELTEGPRPVLLASIAIKPRPARDSLDVELEISSIKRNKA